MLTLEVLEDRTVPSMLFSDTFDDGVFLSRNWSQTQGVTLDVYKNMNDPSGAYSARFDGSLAGGELLQSTVIDLSNESNGSLSYYFERTGGGAAPAAGNDLVLEYSKADRTWAEIDRQSSNGPSMTTFSQRTISLPQDALHSQFELRFRTLAAGGDWFIDNVKLATTTGYGDYWSDQSWSGNLTVTNPAVLTFNRAAPPTGNGSLTITANSLDIGNGSSYLVISTEGNSLGNMFSDTMPQRSNIQQTIQIPMSVLQSVAADGSIQLTISASPNMYSGNDTLSIHLEYPIGTGYLPPAVDLNGPSNPGINFTTTFQAGHGAVPIADPTATVAATVAQPDPSLQGLYAISDANWSIYQINPGNGQSTFVTGGGNLVQLRGVAVDARGDLYAAQYTYPFNSTASLVRINALSGSQEVVPNGDSLGNGVAADRKNGDIYYQNIYGTVSRIDPVTGVQTPLGGASNAEGSISVDINGNIIEGDSNSVLRIDAHTGNTITLASGGPYLYTTVWGTAVEPSGQILALSGNDLVQIDPATGAQTLLSHDGYFNSPHHVVVTDTGAIYVINAGGTQSFIQVDPVTGQQTLLNANLPVFLDGWHNFTSLVPAPANPMLQSATITLTNPLDGSAEVLAANTSGTSITASYDATNAVLHLTGTDSVANYQKVLRTVTYNDTASSPNLTTRQIQVIVNDGTANSATAISTIVMNAVGASNLVVAGFPSPSTAGVVGSFTVTAEDSNGHVVTNYTGTVHFTSSDGQAILPADYTFVAADAGVHTFTITLKTAGSSQSITATDTATSTITGSQTGITVNAAAASSLIVSGFPSPTTAGVAGTVTVTAKDAYSNTATGYTGTVHFTSSDLQAALPADYGFTATDAGQHTFSASLKTAGSSQSITATDTATSTITGSQTGITVNPAAASNLIVSGFPSTTTAGVAGTVTITAKDAYGNTTTGYAGTVHFTSSDAQAALPADYGFTATDAGVHTFNATLKTAGNNQSITATDTATSTITGSQSGITVNPAAASIVVVSGFPSPVISGQLQNFSVKALDPYGNTATGYTGKVHFTSTDGAAALPADYTFLGSDAGVHTFSATLETAGTQSLTATDTATASITGTEASILVKPANFVVSGFPSPTTAGVAHSFTVTAENANGTTATGYTGTVHFTSSDAQAALPTDYTFTAADAGVHMFFSATLKAAGTQSITATDTVTSTITGSQSSITVTAAALSKLAVTGFPSPTVAGVSHSFTVTAKDAYGNTVTSYLGTVHFTSTDKKAVLPGNYTFVAGDAGVHGFTATLKTAGTQTITAKDTVKTTVTGSESILVTAAAASHLQVTAPANSTAGVAFNITVTALDVYGNIAAGYTGTIHFTSSDKKAVLPVNYTFTAGDNGVHVFTNGVTLKTAGSQSVTATDTVTATITGKATIKVAAAQASSFRIIAPSSVTHGVPFTFTVKVLDAFGNVATGYTGTVHFSSSDTAASLPANYTFTSSDAGVHTFSATLNTTGSQSLTATDIVNASITGTDPAIKVV